MEFLKQHLGDELYTQVAEKLTAANVQLADLSGGGYISAKEADKRVKEVRDGFTLDAHVGKLKFSSESAKRAFAADVKSKGLKVGEDGGVSGFDDFVKSYKSADPNAFAAEAPPAPLPQFSASTPGATIAATDKNTAINAGLREVFGGKK
ncbi:hypothetical protein FACS1894202_11180 [Clostridia bacterium]|nr:hypothetical protein FACS1894202_11180 [Clostridia bacterium]